LPPSCLPQSGWSVQSLTLGPFEEDNMQANSFRNHAEQFQEANHCIAALNLSTNEQINKEIF